MRLNLGTSGVLVVLRLSEACRNDGLKTAFPLMRKISYQARQVLGGRIRRFYAFLMRDAEVLMARLKQRPEWGPAHRYESRGEKDMPDKR